MNLSTLARVLAVAVCLGLSACATVPETQQAAPVRVEEMREVADVLAWFDRLASLPVDEQRREFAAAQAAFDKAPGDVARLRLAMAFNLPQAPWRDDARVVVLLAEWAPDGQPTLTRQVGQLLYRLTIERQRLIKEEQRRSDTIQQGEQKRVEALLHDERKKVEDLQQKLDALREIDRNTLKAPRR